jgi:hypothetical protein
MLAAKNDEIKAVVAAAKEQEAAWVAIRKRRSLFAVEPAIMQEFGFEEHPVRE